MEATKDCWLKYIKDDKSVGSPSMLIEFQGTNDVGYAQNSDLGMTYMPK